MWPPPIPFPPLLPSTPPLLCEPLVLTSPLDPNMFIIFFSFGRYTLASEKIQVSDRNAKACEEVSFLFLAFLFLLIVATFSPSPHSLCSTKPTTVQHTSEVYTKTQDVTLDIALRLAAHEIKSNKGETVTGERNGSMDRC